MRFARSRCNGEFGFGRQHKPLESVAAQSNDTNRVAPTPALHHCREPELQGADGLVWADLSTLNETASNADREALPDLAA